MVVMPLITLKPPIQALAPGTIILKRKTTKQRLEETPGFRFITSPRLTAPLAGILGTLIAGPLVGLKAFLAGGLGAGILSVSPKAAKFISEKVVRPEKAGQFIGEIIEDPSILQPREVTPSGVKEKVVEALKEGGPIAAAGALGIGAAALLREIQKRLKEQKIPDIGIPKIGVVKPPAALLAALPSQVFPDITQQPAIAKKEEKPVEEKPVAALPSIKNVFKPSVDISFRKSSKFINQQVIIK